jgi:hypothetical protein
MTECPRESEVFEAVALNRVNDVRDHVRACAICAEIVEVAGALQSDHTDACRHAQLPSAGTVWWRATIRARAEAARTVAQPITIFQGVAGASAVGLAAALVGLAWRSFSWFDRVDDVVSQLDARRNEIAAASALVLEHGLPIMLALALCVVVAPFALYVAFSDD